MKQRRRRKFPKEKKSAERKLAVERIDDVVRNEEKGGAGVEDGRVSRTLLRLAVQRPASGRDLPESLRAVVQAISAAVPGRRKAQLGAYVLVHGSVCDRVGRHRGVNES